MQIMDKGVCRKPGKPCDMLLVCYLFVGFAFNHVATVAGLSAFGRLNEMAAV